MRLGVCITRAQSLIQQVSQFSITEIVVWTSAVNSKLDGFRHRLQFMLNHEVSQFLGRFFRNRDRRESVWRHDYTDSACYSKIIVTLL